MTARSVDLFVTTIDRPPDVVFAYLSDVSRHGEWSPRPFRVEGSSGPVAVGDRFTSVGSVPGDKNHRNDVTVVECAGRRLVLDSHDRGEHFVNTFEVEEDGAGSRVTRTVDAPKPSFPLSVVFPLIMAAVIRPDVNKGLANLKAALERS
ncbi:MAG: SRPBCC family protein [Angustibacter sp.]